MAASRHDKKHRAKQGGAGASFSFKHADEGHDRRVDGYAEAVARLIDEATAEIARAVERGEMVDPSKPFSFARYPRIQARMRDVLHRLSGAVTTAIGTASRREWLASCDKNDAFVASILDTSKLTADEVNRYTSRNLEALNAFQGRKVNGMGLSDRVWRYTEQYREQLEFAIDVGLGEGRSAAELSRDVRKNLLNPDALFRRVRDKRGMLHLSKAAQAFNPGQGVYRSAYKNAMRLTRSEINMAYRQSDWLRWQSLDFVVGYEVKRSQREINSNCPLCQRLVGKYPKWFKFVGWHPQCRCYVVPILQDWDSLIEQQAEHIRDAFNGAEARRYPAAKGVTEMPPGFLSWVEENRTRQAGWKQAPYFVRDNFKGGLLANGLKYDAAEAVQQPKPSRKRVKPVRTEAEKEDILRRWRERNKPIDYQRWDIATFTRAWGNVDITEKDYRQVWHRDERKKGYIQTPNSYHINSCFRNNTLNRLTEDDRLTVDALDRVIARNSLPDNIQMYRLETGHFLEFLFDGKGDWRKDTLRAVREKIGSTFTDLGYRSASAVESYNVFEESPDHSIKVWINAKSGTNAFITNNVLESEIILKRGATLKIIDAKMEDGRLNILCELL